MSKHTPGPWACAGAQTDGKGHRYVVSQEGFTVADLQPNGGHNARLIAAAPELFEALCLAHDYLAGNGWDDDPRLDTIRAAIAKAEGGDHE